MHPCPGDWMAIGLRVLYYARTAVQELNAGTVAVDVILTLGSQWADCVSKHSAVILIKSALAFLFCSTRHLRCMR